MKTRIEILFVLLWVAALCPVRGQGTAFTYQGRLNQGGATAQGIYDLRFTIYDSTNTPGTVIAGPLAAAATAVSDGLFTVTLDFGAGVFTGPDRWLEIQVRTNGGGAFTTLAPRQPLTAAPYAVFAGGVHAAGINGTIPTGSLSGTYNNPVTFNSSSNQFNGMHTGQFFGSSFMGGSFVGNFIGSGSGLGGVWHTAGNFGTTPGTDFLGTLDNQPLEIRVNNQRALRLEPAPETPNVIGGTEFNTVFPGVRGATIAGGGLPLYSNAIAADFGTIGGGTFHIVNGAWGTIAGGRDNRVFSESSTVAGGHANVINSNSGWAIIGGGFGNTIHPVATHSTIGGGEGNVVGTNAGWSFVGGGFGNEVDYVGVVAGGAFNRILRGPAAGTGNVIGGGWGNTMSNISFSAIGGGWSNTVLTSYSFLGGGFNNGMQPQARFSVIGGGETNQILTGADHSVIGGGSGNTNAGPYATVPGGFGNFAGGQYSFAAGRQARATHPGAFVWADATPANFSSTAPNQFRVRADGGVFFSHGAAGVNVDQFNLNNGDLNYSLRFGTNGSEGIASKRTFGGNQFGLDFYTQSSNRLSIASTGVVTIPNTINLGSRTGTSEPPNLPGLVVRRINTVIQASGTVVARSDALTLERDGTNGGLRVHYPANTNGTYTVAAMGITQTGSPVNFYTNISSPPLAGSVQVYANGQNVHFTHISFGDPFSEGHLTEVSLTRHNGDFYWTGTVTSTFNQ